MRPTLSILITTYNKPYLVLQQLISIMMACDMPDRTEVLIYNSGGATIQGLPLRDWLLAALENVLSIERPRFRSFSRLVVVDDPQNFGPCKGTNVLLALAAGEYLYLTNDDMIVNPGCWFGPLEAVLHQDHDVGLVCSTLDNTPYGFKIEPSFREMIQTIDSFCQQHLYVASSFHPTESNQPWLVRARDVAAFGQQDPIANQKKWICEYTDPTGMFWTVDWVAMHKVRLAGFKTMGVGQSVVYHYDHATLRDKDKLDPAWTHPSYQVYQAIWGTDQKELPTYFVPRRFLATRLEGNTIELVQL